MPRKVREVALGEVVHTHTLSDLSKESASWKLYHFHDYLVGVADNWRSEEALRRGDAFDEFLLGTPWGALYHAVEPSAPWSAERMAQRLAAVLRFWDTLQLPRYLHKQLDRHLGLEELVHEIYGRTMEAWGPRGSASVREHLEITVERMRQASTEDCTEAVMRLVPVLLRWRHHLKHPDVLHDPTYLRKALVALSPEQLERFSSAEASAVFEQLYAWERRLEEGR